MIRVSRGVLGAVLLLVGVASADTVITEVIVEGFGAVPQEAVANALAEAVRQVNGVSVDANLFLESTASRITKGDIAGDRSEAQIATHLQQGVGSRGGGLLDGYDVISNAPSSVGYTANVRARVLQYVGVGSDSTLRRKLAVIPRSSLRESYEICGPLSGDALTDRYVTTLEAVLVQSRRFAILDRDDNRALADERARWRSVDVPLTERAKLGQVLGADYLLFTRVLEAEGSVSREHVRLTGQEITQLTANFAIEVRVVLVATGEVKFADVVRVGIHDSHRGTDSQSLIDVVASQVATRVTELIYPVQIIGVEQDQYVLNQGGRSVTPGQRFRVMRRGAALDDPYTHESLGYAEQEIAQLEVTRVDARVSYARLLQGEAGAVVKGMNLKRVLASVPPSESHQEGVRLPFDSQ